METSMQHLSSCVVWRNLSELGMHQRSDAHDGGTGLLASGLPHGRGHEVNRSEIHCLSNRIPVSRKGFSEGEACEPVFGSEVVEPTEPQNQPAL